MLDFTLKIDLISIRKKQKEGIMCYLLKKKLKTCQKGQIMKISVKQISCHIFLSISLGLEQVFALSISQALNKSQINF